MSSADSPGLSTLNDKPLLIFDLDGTILSVNSFPHWVRAMLFGDLRPLAPLPRIRLFVQTAWILVLRKCLRHSHYVTKRRLQPVWTQAVKDDSNQTALINFTEFLLQKIRPNLQTTMREIATGTSDAVLATSAAGEYAQYAGRRMGFRYIFTTDIDTKENNREQKRDRVLAFLAEQNWEKRRRIFFTDHEEDLPLIQSCDVTLWFGADEDVAAIQAAAPNAKIFPCLHRSDSEITALIAQESMRL